MALEIDLIPVSGDKVIPDARWIVRGSGARPLPRSGLGASTLMFGERSLTEALVAASKPKTAPKHIGHSPRWRLTASAGPLVGV